jgi:2-amino-4-hydroxy-6-hydroxymethyldihydropteridine diphosphokinase
MEVGLSLGSNLGDRLANLRAARQHIGAVAGLRVLACSPIYETEPVDVPAAFADQPFLNAVIIVTCSLNVRVLHKELAAIEAELGRRRGPERNAPRPIDIDILYAGQERVEEPDLKIPHPRWAERRFVVQLLSDVRPDLTLPGEPRRVKEVLAALPARPVVAVFARDW